MQSDLGEISEEEAGIQVTLAEQSMNSIEKTDDNEASDADEDVVALSEALPTEVPLYMQDADEQASCLLNFGWRLGRVPGDDNCLYRMIAHQLGGGLRHEDIRKQCYEYLITNMGDPDLELVEFLAAELKFSTEDRSKAEQKFREYCNKYQKPGNGHWGGMVELKALGQMFKRHVHVRHLDNHAVTFWLDEEQNVDKLTFDLSYNSGVHYSSVRRNDDAGNDESKASSTTLRAVLEREAAIAAADLVNSLQTYSN